MTEEVPPTHTHCYCLKIQNHILLCFHHIHLVRCVAHDDFIHLISRLRVDARRWCVYGRRSQGKATQQQLGHHSSRNSSDLLLLALLRLMKSDVLALHLVDVNVSCLLIHALCNGLKRSECASALILDNLQMKKRMEKILSILGR